MYVGLISVCMHACNVGLHAYIHACMHACMCMYVRMRSCWVAFLEAPVQVDKLGPALLVHLAAPLAEYRHTCKLIVTYIV